MTSKEDGDLRAEVTVLRRVLAVVIAGLPVDQRATVLSRVRQMARVDEDNAAPAAASAAAPHLTLIINDAEAVQRSPDLERPIGP